MWRGTGSYAALGIIGYVAWSDYGEWLTDPDVRKGMELIGAAVKRRRRQKFLSQSRLAQMTGIPQSTISRFENGRRCGLSWVRFARLVGVLGGLDFGPLVRPFIPGFEHQLQPNPYLERQRLEAARLALRADAALATSMTSSVEVDPISSAELKQAPPPPLD
jgi:transcriptional regulator with XRE-family HTH domain